MRAGLKAGQAVKAGEQIAVMGRTANTHEGISKDRAHVHFELNLLVNDRFSSWYHQTFPTQRNDHGTWNGQNLLGLDPRLILMGERRERNFSLLNFLQHQTELCRVIIRKGDFPWIKRYRMLVKRNPIAEKEGIAGYELALNYNGVAFEAIPRAASEIKSKGKFALVSVNEPEYQKNPCRRLVKQNGKRWDLTNHGLELLEMLAY